MLSSKEIKQLEAMLDVRFDEIKVELKNINQRLDDHQKSIMSLQDAFVDLHQYVHTEVYLGIKLLETRMEKVELRLDKIEARLDKVEVRLDQVEARIEKVESDVGIIKTQMEKLSFNTR